MLAADGAATAATSSTGQAPGSHATPASSSSTWSKSSQQRRHASSPSHAEPGSEAPAGSQVVVLLRGAEERLLAHTDVRALAKPAPGASSPVRMLHWVFAAMAQNAWAEASHVSARLHALQLQGPTTISTADGGAASTTPAAVTAAPGPPSLLDRAHELLLSRLHGPRMPLDVASPSQGQEGGAASGGTDGASSGGPTPNPVARVKEVAAANAGLHQASRLANKVSLGSLLEPFAGVRTAPLRLARATKERSRPRDVRHSLTGWMTQVVIHDVLGRGASGTVYLGAFTCDGVGQTCTLWVCV